MSFSKDKTSVKKKKRVFLWHSVARIVYRHHTDSFPHLLSPPSASHSPSLLTSYSSSSMADCFWTFTLASSDGSSWVREWERERRRAVTEQSRTSCIHSNTEEMETNQTEERKRCGEDCRSRWITNIKTMRFAWSKLVTEAARGPFRQQLLHLLFVHYVFNV